MKSIPKRLKILNDLLEKEYNKPIKNKNEIKLIKKLIQDEKKSVSNEKNKTKKRIEKVIVKNIVKIELGKFYIDF